MINFSFNKDKILLGAATLAILVTGVVVFANSSYGNNVAFSKLTASFSGASSSQAVAEKTLDYINSNLIVKDKTAVLDGVSQEGGLIKMQISVDASTDDVYVTKDGKLLFLDEIKLP